MAMQFCNKQLFNIHTVSKDECLPKIRVDCVVLMAPWPGLVDSFTIDSKPHPCRKKILT